MVGAKPVDETHVMRKVVIDGSTPFGFQRTSIVALNGDIQVDGKSIPIQTVCVEEDASRKIKENGETVHYRLDRLGIPLVEVVTGPVIGSPEEAEKVASTLGQILRATGKVMRGLGTIRQDLNVSIREGAISEIKGVQELELISKVIELEVQRQLILLEIRDELKGRAVKEEDLKDEIIDVTEIFGSTRCSVLQKALKSGCRVFAVVLPKFSGILGIELTSGSRFGTELADYAKFWGRVKGIFHSDELPAFGITGREVARLNDFLKIADEDAFIFVADETENARDALIAVVERAKAALIDVPYETRSTSPDGTTHYSRPRPGSARMYPETDVSPVPITPDLLKKIEKSLPEQPDVKLLRLMKDYDLNRKLASQLLNSDYCDLFEAISLKTQIASSFVAATLTETLRSMMRDGVDILLLSEDMIEETFTYVDRGIVAKEAIPIILAWIADHKDAKIEDAIDVLGLRMIPEKELVKIVERVVKENQTLIHERQIGALGPLMGVIMKEMRGKIDAEKVSKIIMGKIKEMIEG
jgi:glutamyl-tRNA(Gln) amidotransferase subunit E